VQLTAEHLLRRFKMAASGATPIILYHSTTGSAVPSNANLAPGELAVNIADMKLYCENDSGVVTLLASAAGSAGDVVGPGSATDGAIVAFDGITGKLIKAAVLGTGVQTALGVNTGSAGAVVLFDGALGTPSSGTLSGCTVDGTNSVGFKNIPLSGTKTASYTLVAGDVGKFVELGASGTIVIPASVFAAGDAISVFNNTSASIACTCSAITTVYEGGTNTNISATGFSITTRGVVTILFIDTTTVVITGNLA
jgi:hypothetical protein